MPTYLFYNKETEQEESHFMKISELDEFCSNNPQLEKRITAPMISTGAGGVRNFNSKVPDWHKDNMKEMKKIHPKGNYGVID